MSHNLMINSSFSNFNQYSLKIDNIQKLSFNEEYNLALDFKNNHNLESAKKLVWHNMYLVSYSAKKFSGYNLSLMDLAQEGTVGLMKAVKSFDPDKGLRLASYAVHWIEAEIKCFILANYKMIKIGSTNALRKLFFGYKKTLKKIYQEQGEVLSKKEIVKKIAQKNNLEEKAVFQAMEYFEGGFDSYDSTDYSEDNTDTDRNIQLYDPNNSIETVEEDIFNREKNTFLKKALEQLNEKEKDILVKRYITDSKTTLKELSSIHSISIERARQIEKEALRKMKDYINNYVEI